MSVRRWFARSREPSHAGFKVGKKWRLPRTEALVGGVAGGWVAKAVHDLLAWKLPSPTARLAASVAIGTLLAVAGAGLAEWEERGKVEFPGAYALALTLAVAGTIVALAPFFIEKNVLDAELHEVLSVGWANVGGRWYLLGANGAGLILFAVPLIAAFLMMR
jgi:hypothetical protein